MNGTDLSEHDVGRHPGMDWAAFMSGFDFNIVRVANENGFADRYAQMLVDAARASGKPWAVYAWAVAGWGLDQNRQYAQGLAAQYRPPLGVWADYEWSPRGWASVDEVEGFCRGVQDAGILAGFYSGSTVCPRTVYFDGLPWWLSDYGPNDAAYHDPNEEPPVPNRGWAIHQFTSVGWPGGGSLDVNYAPSLEFAGSAPSDTIWEEDVMIHFGQDSDGKTVALAMQGDVIVGEWGEPLGAFNIPQGALDYSAGQVLIRLAHPFVLAKLRLADKYAMTAPSTGGGTGEPCPPSLQEADDPSFVAEGNARIANGRIQFTGTHLADV